MQDRVPLHPGRVTLTPVAGQANTYDMTRADDPTQAGTPLNKATLLKDATAALFGLGTDAVPDDVLAEIGKYKQYWWRRRVPAGERYVEVKTDMTSDVAILHERSAGPQSGRLSKSITINQTNGAITLNNAETINAPTTYALAESLVESLWEKRPFYFVSAGVDKVYYVPENATYTKSYIAGNYTLSIAKENDDDEDGIYLNAPSAGVKGQIATANKQQVAAGDWEYLQSSDRSAYPDSGTSGGYEYEYLGIPFDNAVTASKIETGSYVGTGTYGQANPNTLTFGFAPKLVIVSGPNNINSGGSSIDVMESAFFMGLYGKSIGLASDEYTTEIVSFEGESMSWYTSRNGAAYQFNKSEETYYYITIG